MGRISNFKRRLAKICADFIKYFLSESNIHGFNHLVAKNRHYTEKLMWLSMIGFGAYGAFVLSGMTLTRYNENPTVISMERDRFAWNTSFPAITVCPTFKLERGRLAEYVAKSDATNKTALEEFLVTLAEASYDNFDTVTRYDEISSDDYMKILLELQFEFKPSISNSGLHGYQFSLHSIISEMGICYSLNSQLAIYNSPEYWESDRWSTVKQNESFHVNSLDGEVFANMVNMSTGFKIFVHGSYEVADVASKSTTSPNGYFLQLYITALTLYSSDRIRYLGIGQRKCRFPNESNLKRSPVYSFVLCRMECRATLARKFCDCVPHFYRKLDGDKICDVSGLHCLAKYKEKLITIKGCACLPNCDEDNFVIEHLDTREWFLGSNLQWGFKEYPRMRLKRDIIFGFSSVLVYIGGMAGLFFGCSVLSFVEILYFFTIRLCLFVNNYGKSPSQLD